MKQENFFFGFTLKFWISTLFIFFVLWLFLHHVGSLVVLPFGFSIIIAYIFHIPVFNIAHKTKLPPALVSLLLVFLLFSSLTLFLVIFVPIAVRNLYSILHEIPYLMLSGKEFTLKHIPPSFHADILESYNRINNIVPQVAKKIFQNFGTLQSFFSQFFTFIVISPIASYYMIKDWKAINTSIAGLIPNVSRPAFFQLRAEIRQRLAGYLVGQVYIVLFFCVFYAVGLSIMGLKFSFTIGVLTGIATIIPYIGFTCGFAIGVITAVLQFHNLTYTAIIIGIFTAGQIIESTLLTPKLMSNKIAIHPLWVVFGFLFFGAMLGFFGVLFAVPLTAIFSVLIKFYVKNYYQKRCI